VFTLVLWLGCVAVGLTGLIAGYPRVKPIHAAPAPRFETLNVELTSARPPAAEPSPPTPPPSTAVMNLPAAPPPLPVAERSPAIALAIPIETPTTVGRMAKTSATPAEAMASSPAPESLTYGEGEGRQPPPEYPARARREGQQGKVTLRLTVDAAGQVTAAEVVVPSPWALLNNAALAVVRERWHFRAGPPRVYDVVIRFELKN
jgi:protein TonB